MSFQLLIGDGAAILGGGSARIPAGEREAFADAHALLARAAAEAASVADRAEAATARGLEEGAREASARAEAEVAARVAELAASLAIEATARRAEIATAALAGAEAIIGALPREEAGVRLALQAVARLPDDERIAILCSSAVAPRLQAALAGREGVTVEARDGFSDLQLELATGAGRIVASLDVQIAALAERWGVSA
ncbi:hypothetical protein [uncultured Sphingomonas sp.]|uniref:hypothetical protein n=1 Tax=uncultured Sphingomonas sp. TaxID=158754 RepID=UPI0035CA6C21